MHQYCVQHNYVIHHTWLYSSAEMWFTDCTHLLHVCDDISHLQSKLIITLFRIGKQNHCLCCVCVCVCVWKRRGERERRKGQERRQERRGEGGGGREGRKEGGGEREKGKKAAGWLYGANTLQLAQYYACSTITIWEHFIDAYCIPCNI